MLCNRMIGDYKIQTKNYTGITAAFHAVFSSFSLGGEHAQKPKFGLQ